MIELVASPRPRRPHRLPGGSMDVAEARSTFNEMVAGPGNRNTTPMFPSTLTGSWADCSPD